jgi:hypothetical protein
VIIRELFDCFDELFSSFGEDQTEDIITTVLASITKETDGCKNLEVTSGFHFLQGGPEMRQEILNE